MANLRSTGSTTIAFGMVSVRVKIYSAASPSTGVAFNLLHAGCKSRLKQQYTCGNGCGVVAKEDMVKAYEHAKDQYVTFTPEELSDLAEKDGGIEIQEFLPLSAIDPVYFDKPYYLAPDKGSERAFGLLQEALRRTGRVGVARYRVKGKMHVVSLRRISGGILMQQLLYAAEVRGVDQVPMNTATIREEEVALACKLVASISAETYDPSAYRDEVQDRFDAVVARKVAGAAPVESPAVERAEIMDMMEALKASFNLAPKTVKRQAVSALQAVA